MIVIKTFIKTWLFSDVRVVFRKTRTITKINCIQIKYLVHKQFSHNVILVSLPLGDPQ